MQKDVEIGDRWLLNAEFQRRFLKYVNALAEEGWRRDLTDAAKPP